MPKLAIQKKETTEESNENCYQFVVFRYRRSDRVKELSHSDYQKSLQRGVDSAITTNQPILMQIVVGPFEIL